MSAFPLNFQPVWHVLKRGIVALAIALGASGAFADGLSPAPVAGATNTNPGQDTVALLQALHNAEGSTASATKPSGGTNIAVAKGRIDNMDALDEHYKLNIGDRVSFRIIEDEDDPKELTVNDSGELEIPYIGLYAVTGKTCKEAARALKTELEKEYYYKATVILAVEQWAKTQGKVYLVGAVRAPGPEELPSDEVLTLSKAIVRAGGFTDYADQRKVRVTRKSSIPGEKDEEFYVDVKDVVQNADRAADRPLEDGDLIYVPERLVRF